MDATMPAARDVERREALAAHAAGAERRNRPIHLLVLALLGLLVAAVMLAWSGSARSAALAELRGEREIGRAATTLAERLKQLQVATKNSTSVQAGEPEPRILSRILAAGQQAGLQGLPQTPLKTEREPRPIDGVVRTRYTYEHRDASADSLLRWLQLARKDIPGLEVHFLQLKPEPENWYMQVVFTRWERSG